MKRDNNRLAALYNDKKFENDTFKSNSMLRKHMRESRKLDEARKTDGAFQKQQSLLGIARRSDKDRLLPSGELHRDFKAMKSIFGTSSAPEKRQRQLAPDKSRTLENLIQRSKAASEPVFGRADQSRNKTLMQDKFLRLKAAQADWKRNNRRK